MNVGGGHVITMEELRRHISKTGAKDVETFIASGNVIFTWPTGNGRQAEEKIEPVLQKALGYQVRTFVRTSAEVLAISRGRPFPDALMKAAKVVTVGFLAEPLDSAAVALL